MSQHYAYLHLHKFPTRSVSIHLELLYQTSINTLPRVYPFIPGRTLLVLCDPFQKNLLWLARLLLLHFLLRLQFFHPFIHTYFNPNIPNQELGFLQAHNQTVNHKSVRFLA